MSGYGLEAYGPSLYGSTTGYVLGVAKLIIPHHADYSTQNISISFEARMTDLVDYGLVHKLVSGKREWGFVQNGSNWTATMYEGGSSNAVSVSATQDLFKTFIGVYNGSTWEFFLDNISQGTVAIGTRDTSDGQIEIALNGSVRNIRIWNSDLSSADVENVTYNRNVPTANLVGQWLITDNSGVLTDSIGSNDGSIVSGSWIGGTHDAVVSDVDWSEYGADCLDGSNIDWPVVVNGTATINNWDNESSDHQFLQTIGYFYRSNPYDTIKLKLHLDTSIACRVYAHFDLGVPAGSSWNRNIQTVSVSLSEGDSGWFEDSLLIPNISGEHQLINMWLSVQRKVSTDEGLVALHQVRLDWRIS